MNDGMLRCAHGKLAKEMPRPDVGEGYVSLEAPECGLCAEGDFESMPYKRGAPMVMEGGIRMSAAEGESEPPEVAAVYVVPDETVIDKLVAKANANGPRYRMVGLADEPKARKAQPIARGVLDYFPDALAEVAHVSWVGNEQHNPGQPMHWAKEKSSDEADALIRHLLQRGTYDKDGCRHTAKVAWRALALLQRELDAEKVDAT